MKSTTARRFGSSGKSFQAPATVAPTIGAALLASGTSETADTAWSPSAACLLPDILPVAGTLLSYGGSRQLAAGGTVTHSGALTLGGALTLPGNPSSALQAAPKQYVDSSVGAIDLSGLVPYAGATGSVNLGSQQITTTGLANLSKIVLPADAADTIQIYPTGHAGISGLSLVGQSFGFYRVGGRVFSVSSAGIVAWGGNGFGLSRNTSIVDTYLYPAGDGTIAQRNGLTAQCHIINKSYTSDSSQEALMLDAGKQISGKLGLYSYRGSSGGSNYPIQIGMLAADGTTFSGLSIATNGYITTGADSSLLFGGTNASDYGVISATGTGIIWGRKSTSTSAITHELFTGAFRFKKSNEVAVGFSGSTTSSEGGGITAYLGQHTVTSALQILSDGGLRVRNLANSADAALTCGAITASGRGIFGGATPVAGIDSAAFPLVSNFGVMANAYSRYSAYMHIEGAGGATVGAYDYTGGNYLPISLVGSVVGSYADSGFKVRNRVDSAYAALTCGAITATGISDSRLILTNSSYTGQVYTDNMVGFSMGTRGHKGIAQFNSLSPISIDSSGGITYPDGNSSLGENGWRWGGLWTTMVDSSGPICETPTQSSLNPTTTNIPSGKRQGWYNSALSEFRDWVNIGGTLLKSAAYT